MTRIFLFLILIIAFPSIVQSQIFGEFENKIKVGGMEIDNLSNFLVVRQSDGTLAVRYLKTIFTGDDKDTLQILSISNDTIFLTNGGFVKLPTDQVDDADNDASKFLKIGIVLVHLMPQILQ